MPWIKVWLHFVWSTKDRQPYLTDEIRSKVFGHVRENARTKGIFIDFINGYVEHVHCLISLGSDQTLEKIMQLIKGESSYWINKNNLTRTRFEWQDEYFVASVSESNLAAVRKYIAQQETHHRNVSFDDELKTFYYKKDYYIQKTFGIKALNGLIADAFKNASGNANRTISNLKSVISKSTVTNSHWKVGGPFSGFSSESGVNKVKKLI